MLLPWIIFSVSMTLITILLGVILFKVRKISNYNLIFTFQLFTFLLFAIYGYAHLFASDIAIIIKELAETGAYVSLLLFGYYYLVKVEK